MVVNGQIIETDASLIGVFSFDIEVRVTIGGVSFTYTEITRKINAVYS